MEYRTTPSSSMISFQKKNKHGILNFMPCYKEKDDSFQLNNKRSVISHPASIIEIDHNKKTSSLFFENVLTNPWSLIKSPQSNTNPNHLFFNREEYPVGEVFLLGHKHRIVAKVAYKQIQKPDTVHSITPASPDIPVASSGLKQAAKPQKESFKTPEKKSVFRVIKRTLFPKKTNASEPEVEIRIEATPTYVADHIAKRLKCDIMIDALCGFGGNTIEFAKHCNFVIAIDSHINKVSSVKKEATKQGVISRIDFLPMDFMKLKKLTGDIVFLDPSDVRTNPRESYSIFKHSQPDLTDLLSKSFEICTCIAIKLPHDTDLTEVSYLFHKSLEKRNQRSKRFCIEIEKVYNSQNEPECIMIYFGDINSISMKEEYQAIYNFIFDSETSEANSKPTLEVVATIIEKIGLQRSIKYLAEIEEDSAYEDNSGKMSKYDAFLAKIVNNNLLSKFFLKSLIEQGSELSPEVVFNTQTPSNSLAIIKKNSDINADSQVGSLIMDSLGNRKPLKGMTGIRIKPSMDNNLPLINERCPKTHHKSEANKGEDIEAMKNSHEVSELAVSSYSVSSSYLNEESLEEESVVKVSIQKKTSKNKQGAREEDSNVAPLYFSYGSLKDDDDGGVIDPKELTNNGDLNSGEKTDMAVNEADSYPAANVVHFGIHRSSVRKETDDDYDTFDKEHQTIIKKALI